MKNLSFFNCSSSLLVAFGIMFIVGTGNVTFFEQVSVVYPWKGNAGFLISLTIVVMGVLTIIISLLSIAFPVRMVLSALLIISASAGHYTDSFGIVIDNVMIQCIFSQALITQWH